MVATWSMLTPSRSRLGRFRDAGLAFIALNLATRGAPLKASAIRNARSAAVGYAPILARLHAERMVEPAREGGEARETGQARDLGQRPVGVDQLPDHQLSTNSVQERGE